MVSIAIARGVKRQTTKNNPHKECVLVVNWLNYHHTYKLLLNNHVT